MAAASGGLGSGSLISRANQRWLAVTEGWPNQVR